MKNRTPRALFVALAAAFPAAVLAQSNEELLKIVRDLQNRVTELEGKLKAAEPKGAPAAATPQWGMTPEQVQEFNRIAVKTEAIEENIEMWGFKGLTISGYAEPAFIYNQRRNRAGFQFLNDQSFFGYDTSYIGSASLSFLKEMEGGTLWKLTLTPNRGVGEVVGAGILEEASVSVPLGSLQTRLIAGQVPDWSGYEYLQPTLNPFITHNLLFDFTLPTAFTGVGIDHTVGKWWLRAMVANVDQPIRDGAGRMPALAYRVDYSRGEFQGWGFAGLHGKTGNGNCIDDNCSNTMTHMFEVDGWYQRGDLTMGGQIGYGQQKQAAIVPGPDGNFRDARWLGVSGMLGYNVTPRLQLLARADYLKNDKNGGGLFTYTGYYDFDENGDFIQGNDDYNGIGPDLAGDLNRGANRYALSVGFKYVYNLNTAFKAEYRFDGADRAVFYDVKNDSFRKNNHLLGAAMIVSF